jgi:CheY-like chemotaxis protein
VSTSGPARDTVLVVDDEESVRGTVARVLRREPLVVLEAADGARALELLEKHPEVRLLVTDCSMPGLNGWELTGLARERWPTLAMLRICGSRDEPPPGVPLDVPHLVKPFSIQELQTKVRELLGRPSHQGE